MKVSSRDYSSVYARTPKNVTNIWYLPILSHSWRIDVCVVPPFTLSQICAYVPQFSENSRERWAKMGEQVMCGSAYLYSLAVRHYATNTFSTLANLPKRQILARISDIKNQFSSLLVANLWEYRRIFGICLFSVLIWEWRSTVKCEWIRL